MMLADLARATTDINELLTTISLATLERLDALPGQCRAGGDSSVLTAWEILAIANAYALAPRSIVHAAAWRLEAVRKGDDERIAADIVISQNLGSDSELARGAVALLAATATIAARRAGDCPRLATTRLCIAASLTADD